MLASAACCRTRFAYRHFFHAETEKEAGGNKGVSDKQIRLKIFSPSVLDITLVDLPGITKVPVGDQPSDIEARIRTMILSHIEVESCLILAVTPANSDLANSDALQMARIADPDGYRTIGVISKLDIMDRGTDARKFLLGKVIPLKLGYVGVVNRSQEDIMLNRSIKDALVAEENFFRSRPVYNDLADQCGIPALAKKLNQILVQHIKTVLPGLKAQISAQIVSIAKEHASYGDTIDSKASQGPVILIILSKYSEAFSSMIEGNNEEMSTSELSGGARIHYIFQSIFVKSLEELDPYEGLSDDNIRTAIQNATGPKSALSVPEVCFEVLSRRQISRLLDPGLQCARLIYDELIKMSHHCLVNELQRFPLLRKRMDEVVVNLLKEGLQPAEAMIGHLIEMEMDYINTSHPNFIGGSKALDIASQHVKVVRPSSDIDKATHSGAKSNSSWRFSSMFGSSGSSKESTPDISSREHGRSTEHAFSVILLEEPPTTLRPSESHSEKEAIEVGIAKLLLKSYYDIVREKVEDVVPKAIMHFLVNHTKRELHNALIKKLYRENLFEEMLREPDEMALKRRQIREKLQILNQAFRVLKELPMVADTVESLETGYSLGTDATVLPKVHDLGLGPSPLYSRSGYSSDSYNASLENPKFPGSSLSEELQSPSDDDADGGKHNTDKTPIENETNPTPKSFTAYFGFRFRKLQFGLEI